MTRSDPIKRSLAVVLALAGLTCTARPAELTTGTPGVIAELRAFFAGAEVRHPGSPGNLAMEQSLASRFAASGLTHGEIRFPAPVFVPGEGRIRLAEDRAFPVHPMHPTICRPGNFAERRFDADLIYLGRGAVDDLAAVKGIDLRGAVAVLEFDCGDAWAPLLRFGVKGFLFLGADRYHYTDCYGKVFSTEARVPRYFVPVPHAGTLRDALLSAGRRTAASVETEPSRWVEGVLRNLWAVVPGADEDLSREVVVITAPLDGNSVVPGMATAAQSGANLHLLMRLFDAFREHPPARTVLFVAVNARTQAFHGERMLIWNLLAPRSRLENHQDLIARRLREEEMYLDHYNRLFLSRPPEAFEGQSPEQVREALAGVDFQDAALLESLAGFIERDLGRARSAGKEPARAATLDRLLALCREPDPGARLDALDEEARRVLWEHVRTALDEQFLIELRALTDSSTGKHLSVKEPLANLAKREVNLLRTEQMELTRRELHREEVERRVQEVLTRREKFVNVLTLFNKVGIRTELSDLTGEELELLKTYLARLTERYRQWAALDRREIERNAANARIREALDKRDVKLVLSLELDWNGDRVAFSADDPGSSARWPQRFGVNVAALAEGLAARGDTPAGWFVDAITRRGGLPEAYFFGFDTGASEYYQAARVSAFALRNVFTDSGAAFTPDDTLDNLQAENVETVCGYAPVLLRAMLDNPALTAPSELPPPTLAWERRSTWTVQVGTFKFDEFSASVLPELPVPHSLVILQYPLLDYPQLTRGDVVVRNFGLTDARATVSFHGLNAGHVLSTTALHFDPDFVAVNHAIDAGDAEAKLSSTIKPDSEAATLALFECSELPIPMRAESSVISASPITAHDYQLLSARFNSAPKRYGTAGLRCMFSGKTLPNVLGPGAFFLNPGEKVKILTRNGSLVLNASAKHPEGAGLNSLDELGPDFFAGAARDMSVLNHWRLRKLRGVSDELAQDFLNRGDRALESLAAAEEQRDHLGYLRSLYEALGAQFKAYGQTRGITNDMLKAVVFYMALMLPFCFFVQKLLFKFVRIEIEMAVFGALFVSTFIIFRFIHPAFRIAEAPEAIFVAFLTGGLGLFVIRILHGRFEGEMQILFNTYTSMDKSSVGYSTVGQQAMLIGVNNMKRRRVRTILTTATIVLVTFTMLAFTSISRRVSPTVIHRGDNAPYTGLMYHWPGDRQMDEPTARVFSGMFAGRADVLLRRWRVGRFEYRWNKSMLPFRARLSTGGFAHVDGILGLAAAEDGFVGRIPLAAGRFFGSDDADEVIITSGMARALDITPDNLDALSIRLQGHDFRIAGILSDGEFQAMKDINGMPLLPIKSLLEQGGMEQGADVSGQDMQSLEDAGVFFVDMSSLMLMPVDTLRRFNATPYSVSVRLEPGQELWPIVEELLTVTQSTKFFISSREPFRVGSAGEGRTLNAGVYYIGEGYRTSIGGLTLLLIPLLIAATIILNTMMGTVYERNPEIAVFNAVGLNPTHIGMFFLAESFVYSVIGSVGGYLIGQVLSIALMKTGVVRDINLNFSSLSVVYVILFTVTVVLLSALYPAHVATKAAVPSGKRRWSLPRHDGHTMCVMFPFIYQTDLIRGILAYLHNYFAGFTEASFGDLIARLERKEIGADGQGRETYTFEYHLALAPFDLGVTQRAVFTARYEERVQAYRISMDVVRLSGQDTNWVTTNRPFLERLRTYLLHWRNLEPGERADYVKRAANLFPEGRA